METNIIIPHAPKNSWNATFKQNTTREVQWRHKTLSKKSERGKSWFGQALTRGNHSILEVIATWFEYAYIGLPYYPIGERLLVV
jgi:hypothetical protein